MITEAFLNSIFPNQGFVLQHVLQSWTFIYALIELCFLIYYHAYLYPKSNKRTPLPECRKFGKDRHLYLARIMNRFQRTWNTSSEDEFVWEFKEFIKSYFFPTNESESVVNNNNNFDEIEIKQQNMDEFMSWGFFNAKPDELTDEQKVEMKRMYDMMEREYGVTFEQGYTENIKGCFMNVDEMTCMYRPLLVYVIIYMFYFSACVAMKSCGFQFYKTENGLRYWYRPDLSLQSRNRNSSRSKLPLLFFHGIAPGGLTVYLPMLLGGLVSDGRSAFFFENPSISCNLTLDALTEQQTCIELQHVLNTHLPSHQQVIIAGHSFGSCQMTWFAQNPILQKRIQRLILIDPVSILLCYPTTMKNFLYKRESKLLMLVSSEIGIEHYLRRHVAWYNSEMWLEDVPDDIDVTVCLSEDDDVVNSPAVRKEIELQNSHVNNTFASSQSSSLPTSIMTFPFSFSSSPSSKGTPTPTPTSIIHNNTNNNDDTQTRKRRKKKVDIMWWRGNVHGACVSSTENWEQLKTVLIQQDALYNKKKSF